MSCRRRIRLEQRVIDQARDFALAPAGRMQSQSRRARRDNALDLLRTAIGCEAVARAARRRHCAGRRQFLKDDLDDALDIGQGSSWRSEHSIACVRAAGSSRAAECTAPRASAWPARSARSPWHRRGDERRAEREHVRAVVLARVARQRPVRAHRRADAVDLVGGNRRPQSCPVDHDPGVGLTVAPPGGPLAPRYRDSPPRRCHVCRCLPRRARACAGCHAAPLFSATPV